MALATATFTPEIGSPPRMRLIYRAGDGTIDLNWPAARIAEAVADAEGTLWVDIEDGGSDLSSVAALFRDVFHFHPLAIDDALTESHSPKVDDWGQYLYLVCHALDFDPEADHVRLHELDIFLAKNYLITYHAEPMPMLERVRQMLARDPEERLKRRADHLLYHILDQGVEEYLSAIEHLDEAIDTVQDQVFGGPTPATLRQIFAVKRSALRVYRIIGPLREVVNRLARDQYPQIGPHDRVYFRDIYDHLVRLHDITESLRDLIAGALDTYLSAISNRTNEVMKTLTIVSVMFLPMSFLAGFFGMNFFGETLAFHSPLPRTLLFWSTCLVMVATPLAMWLWVKRQGWF
ncbi:MAG: magnesium/cobalt transporter CorA [Isosphaeraceae bacterium]|nr:magnesium/cobalt transporter CorA [Isosphaeraceae bacterium]